MKTLAARATPGRGVWNVPFEQAAFKWVLKHPEVAGLIVTMKRVSDPTCFLAASGQAFSALGPAGPRPLRALYGADYCRTGCSACEPACPLGVPIASILRSRCTSADYGDQNARCRSYGRARAPGRCLRGVRCRAVRTACPYGLPVAAKLARRAPRPGQPGLTGGVALTPSPLRPGSPLLALPPLIAAALYWQAQHYDHGLVELRAQGPSGRCAERCRGCTGRLPAEPGGRDGSARRVRSCGQPLRVRERPCRVLPRRGFEGLAAVEYAPDAQGHRPGRQNLWTWAPAARLRASSMDEAGPDAAALTGDVLGFRTANGLSLAQRYYVQLNTYAAGSIRSERPGPDRRARSGRQAGWPRCIPALGNVVATRS